MKLSFRSCPHCGSIYRSFGLHCEYCWNRLKDKVGPFERRISGQCIVNSLFDWVPGQDDLLSLTIMALKESEEPNHWIRFAEIVLENMDCQGSYVIIPIATGRSRNHSLGLARAISNLSGYQVQDVIGISLEQTDIKFRSQNLSQRTRQSSTKFFVKNTLSIAPGQQVLLVDDVVTTGRSLETVQKLLNMENKTKIWTLASRSLAV